MTCLFTMNFNRQITSTNTLYVFKYFIYRSFRMNLLSQDSMLQNQGFIKAHTLSIMATLFFCFLTDLQFVLIKYHKNNGSTQLYFVLF